MRARMAIKYSDIPVELREVDLKDKPSELLEASQKGTIPVLVLPNGKVLEESLDIMNWALNQSDPEDLGLVSRNQLVDENDRSFKRATDRYKYADRFPESADVYRAEGEIFLSKLQRRLASHAYLLGDQKTWVDLAIFPFVRQFTAVDKDWFEKADYPNMKRWIGVFTESDLFEEVMKRFDKWNPGDEPITF